MFSNITFSVEWTSCFFLEFYWVPRRLSIFLSMLTDIADEILMYRYLKWALQRQTFLSGNELEAKIDYWAIEFISKLLVEKIIHWRAGGELNLDDSIMSVSRSKRPLVFTTTVRCAMQVCGCVHKHLCGNDGTYFHSLCKVFNIIWHNGKQKSMMLQKYALPFS